MTSARGTIVSGMRASGRLHIGHLVGALENWVRLQEEYRCFFFVADWHALTTGYEQTEQIREDTVQMILDWLAIGLDPERSILFLQSRVKEHAELHLLLSMQVPLPWLERNPTIKEMIRQLGLEKKITYGLMGYPILQAADILLYKADLVPVGEDQVAHIELTREIARRFNHLCGSVFPEPQAKLTQTPRLPGTDGQKMSKSAGNCIYLSDPPDEIRAKVKPMFTDPQKIYKEDPGRPEICPVFAYHRIFNPAPEDVARVDRDCRSGALGCVEDKGHMAELLVERLAPLQERRAQWVGREGEIWEILEEGSRRAREVARQTMAEVREAMGLPAGD